MSIKVKTPSEWGMIDDTDFVPSAEEFDELEEKVTGLSRKISALTSKLTTVECSMQSMEASLQKQKELLSSLRKDMVKELTSGEWKKIIEKTVSDSVRALETSLRDLGVIGAKQISAGVAARMTRTNSPADGVKRKSASSKSVGKSARPTKRVSRKK